MHKHLARALLASAIALLASAPAPAATSATPVIVAQASPAPKATPAPAFQWGGFYRAYYFTRTNTSSSPTAPGKYINQATFNNALSLHAQLDLGSGFMAGGTYLYANPFNNCDDPATHIMPGFCKTKSAGAAGVPAPTTYDDTLPGYRLSTLYEGYLQFKDPSFTAWAGQRVINTPWANASDSRLKPASFRGGDATFTFDKSWQFEVGDYVSWEDRVQSDFVRSNILTQNGSYPDAGGISQTGIAKGTVVNTNGFLYGRLGYMQGMWTANGYYYGFNNVANALWADAKLTWKSYSKPYIAFQAGDEQNSGTAIAGKINSQVFGGQFGFTPWKNVDVAVSGDIIPQKTDMITLPPGVKCSGHLISGAGPANPVPYFLPGGGTPNCVPGTAPGTATVYYGGWASPYTDSYATDPLFTTMISQGMADRRSPGDAVKISSTAYMDNRRVRVIVAHAWFWYGDTSMNGSGYAGTQETNVDGTYFFNPVPAKGAYHGLLLRHRYAERATQMGFGGLPDFKYNRTQLEYDF